MPASLIADAKSGVSGAGRKAEIGTLFSESSDNFKAYGVSGHRHTPETSAQLQRFTDQKVGLVFTPHLVPMIRGMHATLYARLTKDISNEALQALFEEQYKDDAFVDVMPFGSHPETRSTRGANMLRLALHRPGRQRHGGDPGGAGQPGQGRLRPGRAVHEPDVRPAGNHRPATDRAVAVRQRGGRQPAFSLAS